MKQKKLKLPTNKKLWKRAGFWATAVTAVFALLGVVFMIIGYRDEVLRWMATTGIAFLVIALIPLGVFIYNVIQKKLDS